MEMLESNNNNKKACNHVTFPQEKALKIVG